MRAKCNEELRKKIKKAGLYLYDLSYEIGIAESTLIRWLRRPLDSEHEKLLYDALEKIELKE